MKVWTSAEKVAAPRLSGPSAYLKWHTRPMLERKQGKRRRARSGSSSKPIECPIDRSQEHYQLAEVALLSRMLALGFPSAWALAVFCWEEDFVL